VSSAIINIQCCALELRNIRIQVNEHRFAARKSHRGMDKQWQWPLRPGCSKRRQQSSLQTTARTMRIWTMPKSYCRSRPGWARWRMVVKARTYPHGPCNRLPAHRPHHQQRHQNTKQTATCFVLRAPKTKKHRRHALFHVAREVATSRIGAWVPRGVPGMWRRAGGYAEEGGR